MNQATKRNNACSIEKETNGLPTFKISGWLDANTSPEIGLKLFGAIEAGSIHIIVDFENVHYISSAGLRMFLKAYRKCAESGGLIVLCGMRDFIEEIFEISGINSFIPVVETVDEAMKCFNIG